MYHLETLTMPSQLVGIEAEWRTLFGDSELDNPFLSWEWISAWWHAIGARDCKLYILTARIGTDGPLAGLLPLTIRKLHGALRCLGFAAMDRTIDHLDVIAPAQRRAELTAEFSWQLARVRGCFDVVDLDALSADSTLGTRLLQDLGGIGAAPHLIQAQPAPKLTLPAEAEQFLKSLRKKQRSNLTRGEKRLEARCGAPPRYRKVVAPAELPAALGKLHDLHQARQQQKGNAGVFAEAASTAFQQAVASAFLRNDWLRLYFLEAAGQAIAAMYCFKIGSRLSYYLGGYDPAWSDVSPGALLTARVIREAVSEGCAEFDFLRGDESYKTLWTEQRNVDRRYRIGVSWRGRVQVRLLQARSWAGALKRRFVERY
jgi:CelD/BcsL family acetyltransferase involved in cellulose biosynthesis